MRPLTLEELQAALRRAKHDLTKAHDVAAIESAFERIRLYRGMISDAVDAIPAKH